MRTLGLFGIATLFAWSFIIMGDIADVKEEQKEISETQELIKEKLLEAFDILVYHEERIGK